MPNLKTKMNLVKFQIVVPTLAYLFFKCFWKIHLFILLFSLKKILDKIVFVNNQNKK